MLKAQTNHFAYLDVDLRSEMKVLREEMDKRFEQMQVEIAKRFDQLRQHAENTPPEYA